MLLLKIVIRCTIISDHEVMEFLSFLLLAYLYRNACNGIITKDNTEDLYNFRTVCTVVSKFRDMHRLQSAITKYPEPDHMAMF